MQLKLFCKQHHTLVSKSASTISRDVAGGAVSHNVNRWTHLPSCFEDARERAYISSQVLRHSLKVTASGIGSGVMKTGLDVSSVVMHDLVHCGLTVAEQFYYTVKL